MVFAGTMRSQDGDNPVGLREREDGRRAVRSPACSGLLLSSGIALDVVVHFIPEVLLVPQVMLCSFDVQWIVKIQKISE